MYVCVYVCMHACMCVYDCICMHMYVSVCICMGLYLSVCICMYLHVSACICMYLYVSVCVCVSVCACALSVCMSVCLYVCLHACMCAYTRFHSTGIRYYNQDGRRCTVGCEGLKRSEHYPLAFGTAYVDWWVSQRDTLRQSGHSGLDCMFTWFEWNPTTSTKGWIIFSGLGEFFIVHLFCIFKSGQRHLIHKCVCKSFPASVLGFINYKRDSGSDFQKP